MYASLLAGVLLFIATAAAAQPLPVDALFCNIECASADPQASCRIGLVDGLFIQGKRLDVFALATDDGVELGGELSIPTGDGGRILLAEAALVLRFSAPGPNACQAGFDTVRGVARLTTRTRAAGCGRRLWTPRLQGRALPDAGGEPGASGSAAPASAIALAWVR